MLVRLDRQSLGVALGGRGPQAAGFGEVGGGDGPGFGIQRSAPVVGSFMHVRLDRQGLGVAFGGRGPQAAGGGEVTLHALGSICRVTVAQVDMGPGRKTPVFVGGG